MLVAVPVVHRLEPLERMAQRELGTFGEDVEILVGDDRRDLEDRIVDRDRGRSFRGRSRSSCPRAAFATPPRRCPRRLPATGTVEPSLAGAAICQAQRARGYADATGNGRTMQTFLWHDYETFGADPRRDRPAQFARDPHDARSGDRRRSGLVLLQARARCAALDPGACLVTGITPQRAQPTASSKPSSPRACTRPLAEPGTCGVGYNSLRFDDEFTRHLLYRNFYDPYAREWENGNSRWDLIDLARMCYALRPHGIEWPRARGRHAELPPRGSRARQPRRRSIARTMRLSDVQALLGFARVLRCKPAATVGLASRAAPQAARVRAARRRRHDAAAACVVALSVEPRLPCDRRADRGTSDAPERRDRVRSRQRSRAADRARRRSDRRSRVHASRRPARRRRAHSAQGRAREPLARAGADQRAQGDRHVAHRARRRAEPAHLERSAHGERPRRESAPRVRARIEARRRASTRRSRYTTASCPTTIACCCARFARRRPSSSARGRSRSRTRAAPSCCSAIARATGPQTLDAGRIARAGRSMRRRRLETATPGDAAHARRIFRRDRRTFAPTKRRRRTQHVAARSARVSGAARFSEVTSMAAAVFHQGDIQFQRDLAAEQQPRVVRREQGALRRRAARSVPAPDRGHAGAAREDQHALPRRSASAGRLAVPHLSRHAFSQRQDAVQDLGRRALRARARGARSRRRRSICTSSRATASPAAASGIPNRRR